MTQKFDFTRGDTALYIDESGQVERAPINAPQSTNDENGDFIGSRVPRTITNIWRNSQNTGGSWEACDWNIGSAFTRMRTLDNSGGTVNEFDTGVTPSASSWGTFGFWAKSTDGNKPDVGGATTRQLRILYGGSATVVMMSETEVFTGIWFFCYQAQTSGSPTAFTGFSQNASYTGGVPVQFSEVTIVSGQTTLNWWDSVVTTGASATRQLTDIRTTLPEMANFQCAFQIDIKADSTGDDIIWKLADDDANCLQLEKRATNIYRLRYLRGGSIWDITTTAFTTGINDIRVSAKDGENYIIVNGVVDGSNTSVYSGADLDTFVLFGNVTGTSNKATDLGALNMKICTGLTQAQLIALEYD